MTFLIATAPWNPDERWQPDDIVDSTLIWPFGPLGHNSRWKFQLVAQVDGAAPSSEVLTKSIEVVNN